MENLIKDKVKESIRYLYNSEVADNLIQVQETRKEFRGDFTLVVFPLLSFQNTPEQTGRSIGEYLVGNSDLFRLQRD